ncbi:unnamed protein product [Owenia fusiformis]|uniref:Uncharacterized protein n=1 Tax=Owenia fusiformis TaxID=6347 RepID=A0A8S4NCW4_OWEFU|nr:unnamed protein product [Owenia fusiformis]
MLLVLWDGVKYVCKKFTDTTMEIFIMHFKIHDNPTFGDVNITSGLQRIQASGCNTLQEFRKQPYTHLKYPFDPTSKRGISLKNWHILSWGDHWLPLYKLHSL